MPALLSALLAAALVPGANCDGVLDGTKLRIARHPFRVDDLPAGDWIPLQEAVANVVCRIDPDGHLSDCHAALGDDRGRWIERELKARWKVIDHRAGGCAVAHRQVRFNVHFVRDDDQPAHTGGAATRVAPHRVGERSRRPGPPVLIPPPAINSEAFQRELAREHASALRRASRTGTSVHRTFGVGWEMHHGFFLSVPGKPDQIVTPDFPDERVLADFYAQNSQEVLRAHFGERLSCECLGIAWTFYTERRFIVQAATLKWVK